MARHPSVRINKEGPKVDNNQIDLEMTFLNSGLNLMASGNQVLVDPLLLFPPPARARAHTHHNHDTTTTTNL